MALRPLVPAAIRVDARALAAELGRRIEGEIRFDLGSRALYATDASNYRHVPVGVVVPRTEGDVIEAVAVCREFGAPVLARGGGTGLAGQTCNVAVVLDFSKYLHRLISLDPQQRLARVQPGIVLDDLRAAAERHHLTFGPDPSTHDRCTLGGMIGNNSCGVHSVMAGRTSENVESLKILTYDGLVMEVGQTSEQECERIIAAGGRRGEIYRQLDTLGDRYADEVRRRFPRIPRRVSGYNLDELLPERGFHVARALVGSEGTCVTVLEATVRLVASPPIRRLVVLGYDDVVRAAAAVPAIMAHRPIGLEGFDDVLAENVRRNRISDRGLSLLPPGNAWLVVEFGADTLGEGDDMALGLVSALGGDGPRPSARVLLDPRDTEAIWAVRESGLGAAARVPGHKPSWPGWEDSAVRPDQLAAYINDLRAVLTKYGYRAPLYGHFGEACLHPRIDFDLVTEAGVRAFRAFLDEAADLCVRYGGSLSGEHGDGQARAALYPKMFGAQLVQAFAEFKAAWDPQARMNPGKLVDARQPDQDLRLGPGYRPRPLRTHFQFPAEETGLHGAVLRCVGVGKCRKTSGGTMCPSYMVTLEEEHSTRGRAHLLHEMLTGDLLSDGWRDERVKAALDLCLACKGCKRECPVNVDMATYKAEFLAHYYKGRLRPRSAYAMGLIYWWARLASRAPRLANFLTGAPLLRTLAKASAGIAPQRQLPRFASEPFGRWFRRRTPPAQQPGPRILLWVDTFHNYLRPKTAIAAVEVLEAAGCQVEVVERSLCCGRPLYDYGMLGLARGLLRQVLQTLRPYLDAGVPVVGLEPSCVAVFRDELAGLFPDDPDARRLSQSVVLLGEFLERIGYQPPRLQGRAVVHGHCHQKAVLTMTAEVNLLTKLGLDLTVLDAGCCGMAGSFGFEKNHYDTSMKVGERVLLPAARGAGEALVIANGFSCREQIWQGANREALHLADVLQLALRKKG